MLIKYNDKSKLKKTSFHMKKIKLILIPLAIILLLVIGVSNSNHTNIIDALRNKILSGLGVYTEEVRNVEIESTDYSTNTPGAWHIDKSADWISDGKAQITFDVNSVLKRDQNKKDVIIALDISGSMSGTKLDKAKSDAKELIDFLLNDSQNKVSIITFGSTSNILTPFTNDKALILEKMDSITVSVGTNYSAALLNVDTVMNGYTREESKDVVTLFLTDGSPNAGSPNQVGIYNLLKDKYPYMPINGIQYEMGNSVIDDIKNITDNQWIADQSTLNNILFEASTAVDFYESFTVIDYVDNDNFYLNSLDDITVTHGTVKLEEENGLQKITWSLGDKYLTGGNIKMLINLDFKKNDVTSEIFSSTNNSETVISKLSGEEEISVTSTETPVLKNYYDVVYDGNAPSGYVVSNVPSQATNKMFTTIEISKTVPECQDYNFKGWEIVGKNVEKITDSKFIMPGEDVLIRAIWSKVNITKDADGEVYTNSAKIKRYTADTTTDFHSEEYAPNIISASFVNYVNLDNAIELSNGTTSNYWDLSYDSTGKVIGWLELDTTDPTKFHLYIGTYDRKLWANNDSSYLFYNNNSANWFINLQKINFDNFDTSNVKNMSYMFKECGNLTALDLTNFDTSKVVNMASMFEWCDNLGNIILTSFDTSEVTNMRNMFLECSSLIELDLTSFDTSKVVNMASMFEWCDKLEKVILTSFDTGKVTDMHDMFLECSSLIELNLGSFDTGNVTDMSDMFRNCSKLETLSINHFNTGKVIDMSSMFNSCSSLIDLDLSNLNTSSVANMSSMFELCSSLRTLKLNKFNTMQVTDMHDMFYDCSSLTELNVSSFNTSSVVNMSYMFKNCRKVIKLDLSKFTTDLVTDMTEMFRSCDALETLDISNFKTSNVLNMSYMFRSCSKLTSLSVSSFDTSKVTTMQSMFYGCSTLTTLSIGNFNTNQVKTMKDMFSGCSGLSELNLSSFNTIQVTDMKDMFNGCSGLTGIDFGVNFNTSKVTDMSYMFYNCSKLTDLNLNEFNTSSVVNMSYMFEDCSSLKALDLSSFDMSKVTNKAYMLQDTNAVTTAYARTQADADILNTDTGKPDTYTFVVKT